MLTSCPIDFRSVVYGVWGNRALKSIAPGKLNKVTLFKGMGRVKGTDEGKVHSGIGGTQVSAETGCRERPPWQGLRTWGRTAPAWEAGVQRREGSYSPPISSIQGTPQEAQSRAGGIPPGRPQRHKAQMGLGKVAICREQRRAGHQLPQPAGGVGRSSPWCCSVFSSDPDCG